ncbi:MAG: hypothetical protein OXP66_14460 [Candidatus Tectomicrobia bacterium]|nr:hypothetical protein [Candidatus Tectomicrobia bacterium]
MRIPWLAWSFIPGLNWAAWLHAALLTRVPMYGALAVAYALPYALMLWTRSLSLRIVLLTWGLGIVHTQLLKREINRRLADSPGASQGEADHAH